MGCFELDVESGGPNGNFVYARLIQVGCAGQFLASADGEDGLSTNYLYHLARPSAPVDEVVSKMRPECLKLVSIIRKCKLIISGSVANNVVNKDEKKNAYNSPCICEKIGEFGRKAEESIPPLTCQMGGSGKGSHSNRMRNIQNGFLAGGS